MIAQSSSGTSRAAKAFSSPEPRHAGVMPCWPHSATHLRNDEARCTVRLKQVAHVALAVVVAPSGQLGGGAAIEASSRSMANRAAYVNSVNSGKMPQN